MKTGLKVIDAMTANPVTVSPAISVRQCAKIMKDNHVGSVVVAEDSELLGIITEQDIVYKAVCRSLDVDETQVKAVMTKDMITITPEKDIYDALVRMRDMNVRKLPVLDFNRELVGFLTLKDILRIQPQLFELIVDKLEVREEQRKPIHRVGDKEGLCEFCGEYTDFLFEQDGSMVCAHCRG